MNQQTRRHFLNLSAVSLFASITGCNSNQDDGSNQTQAQSRQTAQTSQSNTCSDPPPSYEDIGELVALPTYADEASGRSPALRRDGIGLDDSQAIIFGAPDGNLYVMIVASWDSEETAERNGGSIVNWFVDEIDEEELFESADDAGVGWNPSSNKIIWLPYGVFSFAVFGSTDEHMRTALISNPGVSNTCFEELSRELQ